jgi:FAD:protein FMN transferase
LNCRSRAAEALRAAGMAHGFVNLGGDIRVLGPRADGRPWRFGIQHPRRGEGQTIASVEMSSGALATSGDYERFFEQDGRRYCHILDPRTGWPVTAWVSFSVTAPACTAAGALSTIAMLKGDAALDFLATQAATFLAIDPALRVFQPGLSQAARFDCGEEQ